VAALRAAGVAATVSGAGPTVLALAVSGDDTARKSIESAVPKGWAALALEVDRAGATVLPLDR
jgi:homoserine kinase